MPRKEFTKKTKRAALDRSGGRCEAVGEWYGLKPGERCNADLSKGVEFDHVDLEANSKDNSLDNCAAVCPRCHGHKTRKRDIPVAAKTQRQQDKVRGIKARKQKIAAPPKAPKPTTKSDLSHLGPPGLARRFTTKGDDHV